MVFVKPYMKKITDFICHTAWPDLPGAVQHQAKRCLMDSLGSMLAGFETPVTSIMTSFACQNFSGSEATILVNGRKASAVGAALANGFAANALDIDDGYRLAKGHPGACLLPVLLAAVEINPGITGKEFLTSLVIGYEIGIRAALIQHQRLSSYHASGSWGAVAGAAVAGRLLGLDSRQIRSAMGVAEYHAPLALMMKGIENPSMVKDSIGWGAMVAMSSALLAQKGFTGIEPLFTEEQGANLAAELGSVYRMLDLYFKPYAACRWAQPAIKAALQVFEKNRLSVQQVKRIRVTTFAAARALNCGPPQNTEQAQYNLAFPIAAALVDGEVGPRQVLPPRIFGKDLLELAAKVSVDMDPDMDKAFPVQTLAQVGIDTYDGRSFWSDLTGAPWEPPHDLPSDQELLIKFQSLASPILGAASTRELAGLIMQLDAQDSLDAIMRLCVP